MQEDEGVFDAADALGIALAATTGMVADMTARPENMRAGCPGFGNTDLADYLVRDLGLPFREAHVSGSIVAIAAGKGCDLDAEP